MKSWITWTIIAVAIILIALVAYNLGSRSAPSSELPAQDIPSAESNTESAASRNTPVEENKLFTVEIEDSEFHPSELKISPGSNVTWVNRDTIPHSIVSDSGGRSGISSGILDNNHKYTVQFLTSGTYSYHCIFHNSERGKIVVE